MPCLHNIAELIRIIPCNMELFLIIRNTASLLLHFESLAKWELKALAGRADFNCAEDGMPLGYKEADRSAGRTWFKARFGSDEVKLCHDPSAGEG